tara:strand:- start:41 stop:421 length:381 start_codon:yes stop_codon:yes gene_type:complete
MKQVRDGDLNRVKLKVVMTAREMGLVYEFIDSVDGDDIFEIAADYFESNSTRIDVSQYERLLDSLSYIDFRTNESLTNKISSYPEVLQHSEALMDYYERNSNQTRSKKPPWWVWVIIWIVLALLVP